MLRFFRSGIDKVKTALSKTRAALGQKITALFSKPIDETTIEELEQILYEADLGTELATLLAEDVKSFLRKNPSATSEIITSFIEEKAHAILKQPSKISEKPTSHPQIVLIVGVNGSGKTTTIAKLAQKEIAEGKTVLLAAGDTFRAAATEQLETWANRLNCAIVKGKKGGDPAAVVFDALTSAKAKQIDTVFIDTAGRLQNKSELMRELEKIKRVCTKVIDDAPHVTLLILDATVGQNALDQTETFNSFTPLTGIALTKLDGTAKGGIALSIYNKFGIPLKWIGLGEKADDLIPFDPKTYVEALFKS